MDETLFGWLPVLTFSGVCGSIVMKNILTMMLRGRELDRAVDDRGRIDFQRRGAPWAATRKAASSTARWVTW